VKTDEPLTALGPHRPISLCLPRCMQPTKLGWDEYLLEGCSAPISPYSTQQMDQMMENYAVWRRGTDAWNPSPSRVFLFFSFLVAPGTETCPKRFRCRAGAGRSGERIRHCLDTMCRIDRGRPVTKAVPEAEGGNTWARGFVRLSSSSPSPSLSSIPW
jgi:hypothetical protein